MKVPTRPISQTQGPRSRRPNTHEPRSQPRSAPANNCSRSNVGAVRGVEIMRGLTVKLRGRLRRRAALSSIEAHQALSTAAEGRRGRAMVTCARGAKQEAPHGPLQRLLGFRLRFLAIPASDASRAAVRRVRSRCRQGRQRVATVQTSPFATSYHQRCCVGVQTCALPQSLHLNGKSM